MIRNAEDNFSLPVAKAQVFQFTIIDDQMGPTERAAHFQRHWDQ